MLRYDNIEIELACNRASFVKFADAYLSAFKKLDWGLSPTTRYLRTKLSFAPLPLRTDLATTWRVGQDVWISDRSLYYRGPRALVSLSLDKDTMLVQVGVKRPNIRQRVRRLLRPVPQSHDYQFFLRRAFHFPLFALLGMSSFFVGHGTAMQIGEKTIILVGVGGAGKSTLGMAIQLCYPETVFITDNYVAFSNDEILPFPEPLRIHRHIFSRETIARQFDPVMQIRDRDYYLARNSLAKRHTVREYTLLIVGLGSDLDVTLIPAARGWRIFHSTTMALPGEFPHGDYPAFIPYLHGSDGYPSLSEYDEKACQSFRVVVPSISSEKQAMSIAKRVIENVL